MPSDADFSRIHKLMEIERLYDELQERHRHEIGDREERIRTLETQLHSVQAGEDNRSQNERQLEDERDRAVRALEAQRAEYESTIDRLQNRLRELSSDATSSAGRGGGGGFFRR